MLDEDDANLNIQLKCLPLWFRQYQAQQKFQELRHEAVE